MPSRCAIHYNIPRRPNQSKNQQNQGPIWDPEEQYDPFRPNDYQEFKKWREHQREEARRIRRQETWKRDSERKRGRSWSGSERSDDSEDDEEVPNVRPAKEGKYFHSGASNECAPD